MTTPTTTIKTLGIIGAGAMGTGIGQVAVTGGLTTWIFDQDPQAAQAAQEQITKRLARQVEKGRLSNEDYTHATKRLQLAHALEDLQDCDLVIEAIVENADVKKTVFQALEAIVRPDALLASNTSSIPIGSIAQHCKHPNRVAGMHFFNPVPLMQLVEIIPAPHTHASVTQTLSEVGKIMGRTPIVVKDSPGFLVNFGGRAFTTEAMLINYENIASPAQIDAIMRDCYHFRMGPFELADLTGIDVNFPVSAFVHGEFFNDPRLKSSPHHRYMMQTGQLGRKTGQGFYTYGDDQAQPSADSTTTETAATTVIVPVADTRLQSILDSAGLQCLANDDGESPILIAPQSEDATAYLLRHQLGAVAHRVVALDTMGDTGTRLTLMGTPGTDPAMVNRVLAALQTIRKVCVINDSPGFVGPRIVAMIANLGCEMAQTGVADPHDIDKAMRLGLNYPQGSLEFCESLGVETVYHLLRHLQALTGDDRYRPSGWLRRRAQLKLPIHTPDLRQKQ